MCYAHVFPCTSDCFGCFVLLCLVVCLTLLASFFLPSSSLIKHVHVMYMYICRCFCFCMPQLLPLTTQSFKEYTLMDVELWMKAVQIDAYYEMMVQFGVKKGADLQYVGDKELLVNLLLPFTHSLTHSLDHSPIPCSLSPSYLPTVQEMGVQDECHRQIILECLDELCKGASSMVRVYTYTHYCYMYCIYMYSHTHTHTLSLTHSHSHLHTLSLTHTLTLTHSHSLSLTHTLTLTHSHSLTLSLSLTLTLTHTLTLSLTHSLTHSLTLSLTHSHSLSLSLTHIHVDSSRGNGWR